MAQELLAKERILELEAQCIELLQSEVARLKSELNARKANSSQYHEGNILAQGKDRAWVLQKIMTRSGLNGGDIGFIVSEVRIESKPLQKLVGKITKQWGWAEEVSQCRFPYTALIYSWDEAKRESKMPEDEVNIKKARTDLMDLLNAISSSSGHMQLDHYLKDRDIFVKENSITHEALWTLFPPGTLILAWPFPDEQQVFIVQSCDGFVSDGKTFHLICYCFDWNGYEFNRVPFKMGIEPWGEDRKSILELPFYPLSYYEESDKTHENSLRDLGRKLIKRGKEYERLCTAERGQQMFSYKGVAYLQRGGITTSGDPSSQRSDGSFFQSSSNSGGTGEKQIEGATMVDFASYIEYQSPQTPLLGSMQRYERGLEAVSPERRAKEVFRDMYKFHWDKHRPDMQMNDEQYLLCPPRVLGYILKQKRWAQLLVNNFTSTEEQNLDTLVQSLQLGGDDTELVLSSVTAHEARKEAQGQPRGPKDSTTEKGKGLVVMLYGRPDLGKTMIAEFVAQKARKPLLSINISDIGIDGDKVETNLQRVFDLAGVWRAVLLFEDADFFLAARGEGEDSLKRGAIISVLPRIIEYYDGILILTTNQIRSFNTAIQSHIHLAIEYRKLSQEQKEVIFSHFLTQIKDKVSDLERVKEYVNRKMEWENLDSRQIRNTVSVALGIALAEEKNLDSKILKVVLERTMQ
ncbi:MAG: hypothetical protein M1840_002373 [Geoglossum simile]|nr:MAG: hypothetical protein M1840_002373 [Geoglossum simile]